MTKEKNGRNGQTDFKNKEKSKSIVEK